MRDIIAGERPYYSCIRQGPTMDSGSHNRSCKPLQMCEVAFPKTGAPWSMTFSGPNFRFCRISPVFSWVSAHSLRRFPASCADCCPFQRDL